MTDTRELLPPGSVISYANMLATVVRDDGRTLLVEAEGERMTWTWDCYGESCRVMSVPGSSEGDTVHKLSTGNDATLGNYRALAVTVFGEGSGAIKFLDQKIAESPNGEREEVIADERQMIQLLASLSLEP